MTQTLPSGSAAARAASSVQDPNDQRSLDQPFLGGAINIAGLDHCLEHVDPGGLDGFEVEALADDRIDDLTRKRVGPPLGAGSVAVENLDDRPVRPSASSNVETFAGDIGRSEALYFNAFPIPHLENIVPAGRGLCRRTVGRAKHLEATEYNTLIMIGEEAIEAIDEDGGMST